MASTWPPSSHPSDGRPGAPPQALPGPQARPSQAADFRHYLGIILPRKWFLLTFAILVLGGTAIYTYSLTPLYKASALILIQPKDVSVMGGHVQGVQDPIGAVLATQYQLLASRRIAEPVYQELKLDKRMSFGAFTSSIKIEPQRSSQMVRVGFQSSNPEEAAKVSDALVQSYINDNRQRGVGISDQGIKQLRAKAEEMRKEVEQGATELAQFRREHPELPLDGTPTIASTRISGLNNSLVQAEAERIAIQAELESLKTSPELAGSRGYYDLALQIKRLSDERERLLQRLKPDHPVVREQTAKLQAAQDDATATHQAVLADGGRRLAQAVGKETRLRAEVQRLSAAMEQSARDLVQFRFMVEANNQSTATYRALMKRIDEIDLAQSTQANEGTSVYLVERADVPKRPIYPDTSKNMLMALIVGLAGGVALCFLIDYLDRSLKSKEEVENLLGLAVLGYLPGVETPSQGSVELVALENPRSAVAEAFRTIRTGVTYGMGATQSGEARTLVVTSTVPRDGKTLCSLNLVIALAQQGKRTLLLECDLRKPRIATVLGVNPEVGLSTFLAGEAELDDLDEVLYRPEKLSRLAILTSGPVPPNPADLLTSERMQELLRRVQGQFDWIVLDAPPAVLADPAILTAHVPNVVFVVRSFVTPREAAIQAVTSLRAVNARVIGAIMNNANLPRAATEIGNYGYGYSYGYGYGYGSTSKSRLPATNGGGTNGNGEHGPSSAEEDRPTRASSSETT